MILPTKGISFERSLATLGGQIIELLDEPRSVSSTFQALQSHRAGLGLKETVGFDWFSLALVLLYAMNTIDRAPNGDLERAISANP